MDSLSPVALSAGQQTRISAFLISCHSAHARRLAALLPISINEHWQSIVHAHYFHEIEVVSLLARTTNWTIDLQLSYLLWQWEMAWQARSPIAEAGLPHLVNVAAFGHALHSAVRPALLCQEQAPKNAFAGALHSIELGSSRYLQDYILLLRSPALTHARREIEEALENQSRVIRTLWTQMLSHLPA
jgi:hypothetical protein